MRFSQLMQQIERTVAARVIDEQDLGRRPGLVQYRIERARHRLAIASAAQQARGVAVRVDRVVAVDEGAERERTPVVVRREGTLMRSSPSAPRGRGERRMRTTSEKPVATYELKKDPPSGELRPKNP